MGVRALAPQELRLRWYAREGVMVLVPGYRGSFPRAERAAHVEINSDGLRDREYARDKAADTFRILVLGDALTAGLQVPAEDTYPKRLEALLAGVHPQGRTEVVNAGIPGYGTADELRYLETFGARWKPDLVVLAFYGGNDVGNNLDEAGSALRRRHGPRRPQAPERVAVPGEGARGAGSPRTVTSIISCKERRARARRPPRWPARSTLSRERPIRAGAPGGA